jgi:transcriptional regulator with XRE-family HTH domain
MTPADFEAFRARLGWTRKELGRELGISQDRLRRLMDGRVPIPRSIALACIALEWQPAIERLSINESVVAYPQ